MQKRTRSQLIRPIWMLIASGLALSACSISLPSIFQGKQSQESPQDIASLVQTYAAGTMQARGIFEITVETPEALAQQTQDIQPTALKTEDLATPAAGAPTSTPTEVMIEPSPTLILPTAAPTASIKPELPPPPPPPPLPPGIWIAPQPYLTPNPEYQPLQLPITSPTDVGFKIKGFHLPPCGLNQAANFRIYNSSYRTLESALISIEDLSQGKVLFGLALSNSPFVNTDRACQPGWIPNLPGGYTSFIHGSMNGATQGHIIRVNFMLCTGDDLTGECFGHSVEFVMP